MLQSEAELKEMSRIGADAGLEVSLFVGPREEWGSARCRAVPTELPSPVPCAGMRQLRYAVDDVLRAVECGIRGFLVADLGLLRVLATAQREGRIPADVVWKVSVMLAPSNPATSALLEELGAGTINLPADLSLAELAEMREACDLPLDLYVEAPDYLGGVVRGEQTRGHRRSVFAAVRQVRPAQLPSAVPVGHARSERRGADRAGEGAPRTDLARMGSAERTPATSIRARRAWARCTGRLG